MPIPPYMWLKDDGGADIKGSVDVKDREGSIYPWSLKVLDYPADKYHAQRDENRADCKTEDCP
ncbi:hypothetical protein AwEntero_18340 [Enterobacterales bacterium]|nr:hypothetical protein AwEntero_18340 [Enterobacterales bacterium]